MAVQVQPAKEHDANGGIQTDANGGNQLDANGGNQPAADEGGDAAVKKPTNKMGLIAATAYIVGTIIGSGIFVSPKGIVKQTGSIGLALIIWATSGVITMFTALVYIELGTSIRVSGGEFAYMTYAGWHPLAFAFLWTSTTIQGSCSCAIMTTTFGDYISEAVVQWWDLDSSQKSMLSRLCSFLLLMGMAFLNLFSLRKFAARVQTAAAVAKIAAVLMIIGSGLWQIIDKGKTENLHGERLWEGGKLTPGRFALAIYAGNWAYGGYDTLNYGSEEIKNFRRTLPIAVISGLALSIVVYLLANIAYFSVLLPQDILDSDAVATTFAKKTMGDVHYAMPAMVGVLMLGTLNADIFIYSRVLMAGGREGRMPTAWATVNRKHNSPRFTVLLHSLLAAGFSFIGAIEDLINYMTVVGLSQQACAVAALCWIKYRKVPVHPQAITFPLILPVALCLFEVALVVIPIFQDTTAAAVGAGCLIFFLAVYYVQPYITSLPALQWLNEKSTVLCQLLFDAEVENESFIDKTRSENMHQHSS